MILLLTVILVALVFEYINGFHDTGLLETQSQRAQNWN